ncbi:peptide ABC transporter substrate-binding protein [Alkalihalobacillus sp. AL-G]|uniref:peptide ABC transporter substrate-binding protein n=1 Tax=Alkalihalobacillus sp. AL-G TaxID=2926399 RepID=UPI00272ABE99|nr:peptide ABC transporter substrate-binding protein [Alkalihalobacillus sp. AL-G]WLD94532.1 peptide ABC transporter substrate-binding protein [Alkalihalobacillus sp. AL-G]
MKRRLFTKILCFMVVLSVFLTGCNFTGSSTDSTDENTDGESTETGTSDNVLNLSIENDIPDLNQVTTTDSISFSILNNVMEGLYRLDENNEPQPAMAKEVEVTDDKLTYTFTLRDDIKWSNGEPITANDFKYSWMRAMHPDTAGSYSFILADYIKGAKPFSEGKGNADSVGIEVKDDKTLVVHLEKPTPYFLGLTAFVTYFPLNKEFVESQGGEFGLSGDAILYNGPYVITDFGQAEGVVLEKNDQYWDKENVQIEKIDLKVVKELSTALNLYEAGELDRVKLSSANVDAYKDSPEFGTQTNFRSYYVQFNLGDETIANDNIRKALQLAYDPKILEEVILNNGSEAAYGLIPPKMTGPKGQSFREAQGPVIEPDVEKAKELWAKGVDELGFEPELELLTADDSVSKDSGTFLQSQYKKNLGIDISLVTKPYSGRLQAMRDDDFQMVVSAWGADYNDPMTYMDLWAAPPSAFRGNYSDENYDDLVLSAKDEPDDVKRMNQLLEAEKILLKEDAVLAPLYYQGAAYLQKTYVKNLVFHPYGASWDYKYAKIEK